MAASKEVREILEVVDKAGKLLEKLSLDPKMRQPQAKADGSPVTKADIAVSDFLLKSLAPFGYMVVSEEDLPTLPPGPEDSYFLVDPLDGTKYFARGEDEFVICVGLLKQGQPYMGAIYDPTRSLLYWAEKGVGAFCGDEPIGHPGVDGSLSVFSSGFHKRPEKDFIVSSLGIGDIQEKGSALKFCDIASGRVDLYMRFGPTSEWDTAAAQVILEEADCVLYEIETLAPMQYGKPDYLNKGIMACHKSQTQKVLSFLKTYGPLRKSQEGTEHG